MESFVAISGGKLRLGSVRCRCRCVARGEWGLTTLRKAANCGTPATIQFLLAAAADAKDRLGRTPFDLAEKNGKLKNAKA